jgi:hypothetical protein
MRPAFYSALVAVSISAIVACSSGGAYASKCEAACQPPSGPCASSDVAACKSKCTAATDGLTATCAQCVIEHSGWSGKKCNPQNGCVSSFGPGATSDLCASGSMCTAAADDACTGFTLGKASSSTCAAFCGVAAGDH